MRDIPDKVCDGSDYMGEGSSNGLSRGAVDQYRSDDRRVNWGILCTWIRAM